MVATELVVRLDESPSIELNENASITDSAEKLTVPTGKKRRVKSPTPARALSTTPTRRSRSKTPFNLYLSRHSADPNEPSKWRSITPFINRKDKEMTPFELGRNLKDQLISHKMVFDKASVMDISEADFEPVRYITSDVAVIDRASVMDVSNVEVIYLVEEYDEEEIVEEEKPVEEGKKKKGKKGRKSKSADKEDSPGGDKKIDVKAKKKSEKKKKDDSRSPSLSPPPKLTLKLELGGGSKINKKLFEKKPAVEQNKPPPKKGKLAMQMEEQAKQAAKDAKEAAKRETDRNEAQTNDEHSSEDEIEDQEDEIDDESENVDIENDDINEQQIEDEEQITVSAMEEDEESIHSEKSPSPIKEPTRSPSPQLPPPRPAAFWKKVAATEGEDFMEKMKFFYSVKREKPNHPAFINKLKDICATETNKIRMVCAVYGPDLTIKWFKDDILIKSNDRYNFTENDEIVSMEIYNCKPSDTADYSVTISNKYQKITSTCYVNVCEMGGYQDEPYAPKFEGFEELYHYLDDKLIIECKIKGIPRPDVTWSRNDDEITHSKEYTLVEGAHGSYQLIINHPTKLDSGIYQVKAQNSRGVEERKHIVEFLVSRATLKSRI